MRASTVIGWRSAGEGGRYDLDGAQRAVKSRVEFTSWLTFSARDCVTIYDGVGFAELMWPRSNAKR